NVCIVGDSENGKSVFIEELMISTLEIGGRVFVFDVGRKFEKTCRLLDGQFIDFATKTNLSLNPFSIIEDNSEESLMEHLAMLKSFLVGIIASTIEVDDIKKFLLEKAIFAAWGSKGKEATITDVVEYLKNQDERRVKDLGTMLFPYTKDGVYGRFFEGLFNLNFDKPFVVIELGDFKEDKSLQTVVMNIIIFQIMSQMFLEGRKIPFHIVIDEAQDILRSQSSFFIETLARRLRPYYGSLVIGMQSVNDFYTFPGALAAFENSGWMCFLPQKKESIDQIKKNIRFSNASYIEDVVKSLQIKNEKYAEIMIIGASKYFVGCINLNSFSQTLYLTKKNEFSDIKSLQEEGLSLSILLRKLLKITMCFKRIN
ncbi:MAG: ATP-binding protein, partial [Alphaproteobacteria bacterium]|nr:ATP-binding protein [Alphaproteobacteria bacterium]